MKKPGVVRRGINLSAVQAARICDSWAASLLRFVAPDNPGQRRITAAEAIATLDEWIAEGESAIAGAEPLTPEHRDATVWVEALREFRNFMTGED